MPLRRTVSRNLTSRNRPMTSPALNGTVEDAAAFFRCSPRTVRRWIAEDPPRLSHFKLGGSVRIEEDAIIQSVLRGRVGCLRGIPGADAETVRVEWRALLELRRRLDPAPARPEPPALADEVSELRARVAQLEQLFEARFPREQLQLSMA